MAEQQRKRSGGQNGTEMMPADDVATIDLVELMYRLLANWKLIACMALAFALAACLVTACLITPLYKATSTIYVLSRRDTAINMSDLQIGSELTGDYIQVFKMWEVHEEVISNLNLPYTYKQMQDMLSVVNTSGTRMLDITVTSPSAQEAASIANEYAKVASQYIAETMSIDQPSIMSVALVPANPSSPSMTKNVILGFLLGGILAGAIVVVQMLVDDKYKTTEDIRKYVGLATLAVIPLEDGSGMKNQNSARKARREA